MNIDAAMLMARSLMTEHGVGYMSFGFHDGGTLPLTTIGKCYFRKAGLSLYLPYRITVGVEWIKVMTSIEVKEIILHEIAHAKAPHGAAHGPAWQDECYKLGIEAKVRYSGLNVPQSVLDRLLDTAGAVA